MPNFVKELTLRTDLLRRPKRHPRPKRRHSWLTGSRRTSPLANPRIWLLAGLLVAFVGWHDYGPAWSPLAVGQDAATADRLTQPATTDRVAEPMAGTAIPPGAESASAEPAAETEAPAGHSDPVAPVLAAIVLILLCAKLAGDIFERLSMPAVLGELVVGVVLGNFVLLTGFHGLDFMQPPTHGTATAADHVNETHAASHSEVAANPQAVDADLPEPIVPLPAADGTAEAAHDGGISVGAVLQILAGIGVVLLLFEVGLESTIAQMMSVGVSSFIVAVLGVVAPMGMGFVICYYFSKAFGLHPGWQAPVFIGATLCATSVGITARVIKDIGRSKDKESQIILGAAVIDDVLGLIVLAVVSGVIAATDPANAGAAGSDDLTWTVTKICLLAFGFIGVSLLLGVLAVPKLFFSAANFLRGHGLLIVTALMICFGMAYIANLIGLAPIVGAFAAGLILETAHYHDLARREDVELEEALHPLTAVFVPIFFVQMGMGVKLDTMGNPAMWGLAITITVIAIIGKQVCALGVTQKGLNRLAVGLGMIPRGEVGLIFAAQGHSLRVQGDPVVNDTTFSAIIFMVLITTLVTPPLLKWAMNRGGTPTDGPILDPPGNEFRH